MCSPNPKWTTNNDMLHWNHFIDQTLFAWANLFVPNEYLLRQVKIWCKYVMERKSGGEKKKTKFYVMYYAK